MEAKVKIPDEIAARAKARGLKVEAYIEEILAQQVGVQTSGIRRPETPAEIRAWLDSLAQFSDKIPPLPETITREWIYQEHN
jgi:post-segregation antitoxin (ccd killing protein)